MPDIFDKIPIIGPYIPQIALTLAGQPELAAAYSGISSGVKTGNPLTGAMNAVASYGGGQLGGALGGASNTLTGILGNAGAELAGGAIGSKLGGTIADNVGQGLFGKGGLVADTTVGPTNTNWRPSKDSLSLPTSLASTGYNGLTPEQQSSNIATQGVYGGGNGSQESSYFKNLINNKLDDTGWQSTTNLSPIEQSYLSQLGYGNTTDSNTLMKRFHNFNA